MMDKSVKMNKIASKHKIRKVKSNDVKIVGMTTRVNAALKKTPTNSKHKIESTPRNK